MTPRVDIIGIDIEMEIDQIKDIFFSEHLVAKFLYSWKYIKHHDNSW